VGVPRRPVSELHGWAVVAFRNLEALLEQAIAEHLSHVPVFVRGIDGTIIYWSNGAEQLYGYSWDEAIGAVSHTLLKTVFPCPLEEIEASLSERDCWAGLLQHTRADGADIWVQANWRLRRTPGSHVVVETCTDVTEREVLSRELAHRVKNMLSIVQSLARFSFAGGDPDKSARFEARLNALSQANDLLLAHQWEGANLRELLDRLIARFGLEDRFTLDGPDAGLRASAVIAYSLAFHELMTNAIKHGALSAADGRVDVVWRLLEEETRSIHLMWCERGGPPVSPPESRGFGLRLIERSVAAELGTPVKLHFEPDGLVCQFDGPLQKQPWSPLQIEAALEAESLPSEGVGDG
jgi:two-component system CheB/CheR fusion protein